MLVNHCTNVERQVCAKKKFMSQSECKLASVHVYTINYMRTTYHIRLRFKKRNALVLLIQSQTIGMNEKMTEWPLTRLNSRCPELRGAANPNHQFKKI